MSLVQPTCTYARGSQFQGASPGAHSLPAWPLARARQWPYTALCWSNSTLRLLACNNSLHPAAALLRSMSRGYLEEPSPICMHFDCDLLMPHTERNLPVWYPVQQHDAQHRPRNESATVALSGRRHSTSCIAGMGRGTAAAECSMVLRAQAAWQGWSGHQGRMMQRHGHAWAQQATCTAVVRPPPRIRSAIDAEGH